MHLTNILENWIRNDVINGVISIETLRKAEYSNYDAHNILEEFVLMEVSRWEDSETLTEIKRILRKIIDEQR